MRADRSSSSWPAPGSWGPLGGLELFRLCLTFFLLFGGLYGLCQSKKNNNDEQIISENIFENICESLEKYQWRCPIIARRSSDKSGPCSKQCPQCLSMFFQRNPLNMVVGHGVKLFPCRPRTLRLSAAADTRSKFPGAGFFSSNRSYKVPLQEHWSKSLQPTL